MIIAITAVHHFTASQTGYGELLRAAFKMSP
jgi:hypothetical protein